MLFIIQCLITLICLGMLVTGILNLDRIRRDRRLMRATALPDPAPLISVCIPARNEARNIAPCLDSLVYQNYPNYEVLVLDDCSEDQTREIAEALAQEHPLIRVLHGRPLERGWIGKPHACHQLAAAAKGQWLLFTDADTVFTPTALEQGLRLALARRADLLSGLVRMETLSIWERLSVPLLSLIGLGAVNFELLERLRWPWYGGASGAFLFFRRTAYDAIGGHESVRGRIVEDIELARQVKRAGRRLVMSDLTALVSCRMYMSFAEVWEGFTKNIYAAFPGALALGALLFIFGVFTAPWLSFLFGSALGWGTANAVVLPLVQILSVGALRVLVDQRMGKTRFTDLLLTPLAGLLMCAITIRSASRAILKHPTPWRARNYDLWKQ